VKIPLSGLRGQALREAAPDLKRTIDMVRRALDKVVNATLPPGEQRWFDLDAVYADSAVIYVDGRYWSYPYSLVDGVVSIGEPTEVVETFVPMKEAAAGDELRMVEADGQVAGTVWEATLICAGPSLNNVFYSDALLREAVPLFSSARICLKSDVEHIKGGGPDLRNVVGWIDEARFVEGAVPDTGRLVGTLNLSGLPDHTRSLLVAAVAAGKQDIAGLSIDAVGKGSMRVMEGKRMKVPARLERVISVDLIVEPGAGGRLIRLVEAAPSSDGDPDMKLREKMLRLIEAKNPAAYAKIDPEKISDDDLETAYREAVALDVVPPADTKPAATGTDLAAELNERLRMIEARANARSTIAACNLPQPAKDKLEREFAVRESFVDADVTAAITAEREYLARYTESGHVRLGGFPDVRVEDRSAVVVSMLDAFFDDKHKDHRDVQSFKECYIAITGDQRVTGRLENCDMSRLRESVGMNLREATVDSTTFAQVLGDAITRRALADYRIQNAHDAWRLIANVVPVTDFRTQHRTRWGGYSDLPDVAEGADYQDGTVPDDEEATYKAAKKGRLSTVTLEAIKNDDVGMLRQIPTKLSSAAKRTLSKFAFDFLRTNPVIYDGKALFHVDHGNLGTAALSADAWKVRRLAMMQQQEMGSNERLSIPPRYLLVPSELEELAYEMFKNRGTNNDPTFVMSTAPTVVPVWYWTDATDWVVAADKSDIPSIELGFLDGREEPEIFVQDTPSVGSMFASDKLTYKIRHVYGGAVTDYRGLAKNVVAG
jgi:hypothetical protein